MAKKKVQSTDKEKLAASRRMLKEGGRRTGKVLDAKITPRSIKHGRKGLSPAGKKKVRRATEKALGKTPRTPVS